MKASDVLITIYDTLGPKSTEKQSKLQSGNSLSPSREDSKQVVPEWVAQVRCEVLHRPFSSDVGLQEETEHCEHRQSPILDLLHLEDGSLVRVVGETQRVEWATWVKLVLKILQA